jgi:hypothetical protein
LAGLVLRESRAGVCEPGGRRVLPPRSSALRSTVTELRRGEDLWWRIAREEVATLDGQGVPVARAPTTASSGTSGKW